MSGVPDRPLEEPPPRSRPGVRLARAMRTVVANLAILLALLLATNLASAIALDHPGALSPLRRLLGIGLPPTSSYVALPVYRDKEQARRIWRDFDASHVVRYQPFVEWRRKPYSGPTTHVGADGNRFWPGAPKPPAGAPVVRVIGGSSTWGTGVADDETIPAALQLLRPRLRVVNNGESEHNSRQGLELLENLLVRGERTDVVVLYEGFNDVLTLCRDGVSVDGHGEERRMRLLLDRAGTPGYLLFGRTLELLGRLVGPGDPAFDCDTSPARARAVASTVERTWRLARAVAAARGAELVVVLQPVAAIGTPELGYFDDVTTPGEPSPNGTLGRQLRAVYPYWQRLAARPGNAWLHDLTALLDGAPPTYIDHVHLSAEGNARVARALAPVVDAALARP